MNTKKPDLSAIETRIAAAFADQFADRFGTDRHAARAAEMFGVPVGEVTLMQRCKARAKNYNEDGEERTRLMAAAPPTPPNPKFYGVVDCWRKADQHWDMAGLARRDCDFNDERAHLLEARMWTQRAKDGGWTSEQT